MKMVMYILAITFEWKNFHCNIKLLHKGFISHEFIQSILFYFNSELSSI